MKLTMFLKFVVLSILNLVFLSSVVSQSYYSQLPDGNWYSLTSDVSGQYLTAAYRDSQFYYSKNGGNTWVMSFTAMQVEGSASSSSGAYVLVVNNGLYVSFNYGANFTKTSSEFGNYAAMSASGSTMVAADSSDANGCLSYSNNYGTSFSSSLGPDVAGSAKGVAMNAAGTIVVLSVDQFGLYVSSDPTSVSSWTLAYNSDGGYFNIASGGNYFYAGLTSTPYSLALSTNGGITWTVQANLSYSYQQICVDSSGEKLMIGNGGLQYSQNSGVSFIQVDQYNIQSYYCALNGNATFGMWAGNSEVYYGNPNAFTPSVAPTRVPTSSSSSNFPSNPKYAISMAYSDSQCTDFTSMGSVLVDTCIPTGTNSNYMILSCSTGMAVNTFYTDSSCSVPTGSVTDFTLNQCSVNGGTGADYNLYVEIVSCGVSDPFSSYPDSMPVQTYYNDANCGSNIISVNGYVDDLCMQGSTTLSGLIDWSQKEQYVYYGSPNCQGTGVATALSTSCVSSSDTVYGYTAYYTWNTASAVDSNDDDSSGSSGGMTTGVIVGIAVGGFVVLVVAAVAVYYFCVGKGSAPPLSKQEASSAQAAHNI